MDDRAKLLHLACGAGGPHCDCCNDTAPRGPRGGRKGRQRARAALRGTLRTRARREALSRAREDLP